jgi:hypothetical protein
MRLIGTTVRCSTSPLRSRAKVVARPIRPESGRRTSLTWIARDGAGRRRQAARQRRGLGGDAVRARRTRPWAMNLLTANTAVLDVTATQMP